MYHFGLIDFGEMYMRVVQINATCGSGSTGKICTSISSIISNNDIENYILYSSGRSEYPHGFRYMTDLEVKMGALESRIRGNFGFNGSSGTKKMISKLKEINPDIVHLHNIHSHNCNLEILFDYLKKEKKNVVWTFHDCWAFTGSCTYFSYTGCEKWKTKCNKCPKAHEFSWFLDTSKILFDRKKEAFKDSKMIIVTPSKWLAELVKDSFLKSYPVEVINNGIDRSVFKPTHNSFREDNNISNSDKMILGVGFEWGLRKGLDIFIELSKRLPDHYKIVLVGTNDDIDKQLPQNILSIHRTENQKELAAIYSAADVFVNPTREDNYPTVNMESLSCGTPVITFNTGGSPEIIDDTCGIVVKQEDVEGLIGAISRLDDGPLFAANACLKKANEFDQVLCFSKYLDLYRKILMI